MRYNCSYVQEFGDSGMLDATTNAATAEYIGTPSRIIWNEEALQPDLFPVAGDVLITLDRANVASDAHLLNWTHVFE